MYVNVGALDRAGARFRSKKALRDALTEAPSEVLFDKTSPLDGGPCGPFAGDGIPEGITLQVVGPDPYTARRWYASVTRTATGISMR